MGKEIKIKTLFSNNSNGKYYFLLVIFVLLAYWPLSFHFLSLKNDALSYFLPFRYHISQSIHNGYFPFWSPYLYTGLPLHADIQSGVWNPVVMLISVFTTYNMSVLEWETVFYIIIGGIGFFKLCLLFNFRKPVSFLLAASYACCGFIVDSGSFIPWITSAAYLPFVFYYTIQLRVNFLTSNSIKLGISAALLFLAGYPSFFICAAYIILFTVLADMIIALSKKERSKIVITLKQFLLSLLFFLLIVSPALISWIEFFPYYNRGSGASLAAAQKNPFVIENVLSYILPPATYKLNSGNDFSFRNAFIGMIPLLFLVYSFRHRFLRIQKLILGITAVCFLFSLGEATPVRAFFYYFFPFMDSFRHPGTIRLFTSIGILLLSGFGMELYFNKGSISAFKKIIYFFLILLGSVLAYHLFFSNGNQELVHLFQNFSFNISNIKTLLDLSTLSAWIIISGFFQITCLVIVLLAKNEKTIISTGLVNLFIMLLFCIPFTLVSQYSTKTVNQFIQTIPEDFPVNLAWEKVEDKINDPTNLSVFGYLEFYTKKISVQDHIISPTLNADYSIFLKDTLSRNKISNNSFAYFDLPGTIALVSFAPNDFNFRISTNQQQYFFLSQQYNHNWKAYIDGKIQPIEKDKAAFMKIRLPQGNHEVRFLYSSGIIIAAYIVSMLSLLGCIALLVYFRRIKA